MGIMAEYHHDAELCMAEAMDYAANDCHLDADAFIDAMIVSGYADRFSRGSVDIVAGISGIELAIRSLSQAGYTMTFPQAAPCFERRPAYWAGYILGHYVCVRDVSIRYIHNRLRMKELILRYPVYHELDETRIVTYLDTVIFPTNEQTALRRMRKRLKYTQEKLAELTGLSKSSITQYERREKDINHASMETAGKLANVLHCDLESLMERQR